MSKRAHKHNPNSFGVENGLVVGKTVPKSGGYDNNNDAELLQIQNEMQLKLQEHVLATPALSGVEFSPGFFRVTNPGLGLDRFFPCVNMNNFRVAALTQSEWDNLNTVAEIPAGVAQAFYLDYPQSIQVSLLSKAVRHRSGHLQYSSIASEYSLKVLLILSCKIGGTVLYTNTKPSRNILACDCLT